MNININTGGFGKMFGVPDDVVDHYIKLASGKDLKVLLIILRHSKSTFSSEKIAKMLDISIDDVDKSIRFWNSTSICPESYIDEDKEDDEIIKPTKVTVRAVQNNQVQKENNKTESIENRISRISPVVMEKLIKESNELGGTMSILQNRLHRDLTVAEKQGILYMYNELNIELPAINILIEWLIENQKFSIKYAINIAYKWKKKGITTLDEATAEIKKENEKKAFSGRIHDAFHLRSPLTSGQQEYINKWIDNGYSYELIIAAYENAIEKIDHPNFKYIDTTLNNWHKTGITTPEEAYKNNNNSYNYNSYGRTGSDTGFSGDDSDIQEYIDLLNTPGGINE